MTNSKDLVDLQNQLNAMVDLHKQAKLGLPRKSRSRKWAIWLLQGASLSLSNHALKQLREKESVIYIAMNLRMASEIRDQILYFNSKSANVTTISNWFNNIGEYYLFGKAIPDYSKYKTTEWRSGSKQSLNNVLSAYAHPSYDLTKFMFEWTAKKGSLEYYSLEPPNSEEFQLNLVRMFLDFSEEAIKIDR